MARLVEPEVLARAGEAGQVIFGLGANAPYLELWQWDRERGGPRDKWAHLHKD